MDKILITRLDNFIVILLNKDTEMFHNQGGKMYVLDKIIVWKHTLEQISEGIKNEDYYYSYK